MSTATLTKEPSAMDSMTSPIVPPEDILLKTVALQGERTTIELPARETLHAAREDVHFFLDRAFGRIYIVRPDGPVIDALRGIGDNGSCMLFAVMMHPGRWLARAEVAHIAGLPGFLVDSIFVTQRKRLRAALGESGDRA